MSNYLTVIFFTISTPIFNLNSGTADLVITLLTNKTKIVPSGTVVTLTGKDETGSPIIDLPQDLTVGSGGNLSASITANRGSLLTFTVKLTLEQVDWEGSITVPWPLTATTTLAPPIPDFRMNIPNVIDESLIKAYTPLKGLPFLIPKYFDSASGDKIYLYMNGIISGFTPISSEESLPAEIFIDVDNFNYTGLADIYYIAEDKVGNVSASQHLQMRVSRPTTYPAPYQPYDSQLAAPVPVPVPYLLAQFRNQQTMRITGTYDEMQVNDVIKLELELRGTTVNYMGQYYPFKTMISVIEQNNIDTGEFEIDIDYMSFNGIDGNIGRIYFSLYQSLSEKYPAHEPAVQIQSFRAPITIDVVAPFKE